MTSFFIFWAAIGAGVFFCLEFAINGVLAILNTLIDPEANILKHILIAIGVPMLIMLIPSLFSFALVLIAVLLVGSLFGITQLFLLLLELAVTILTPLLDLMLIIFAYGIAAIIFILESLVRLCEKGTTFFLSVIKEDACSMEV